MLTAVEFWVKVQKCEHEKAWKTEQAYPPEALMAWVGQMAREGGQGEPGKPVRKIK